MRLCVAIVVTAMFAGASAPTSALTASELLAQCGQLEKTWVIQDDHHVTIRTDVTDAGRCWGYVNAYLDLSYIKLVDPSKPNEKPTRLLEVCPPSKGFNQLQLVRMFLQEARNQQAELHNPAFVMLSNLLTKNFPCPK